MRTPLPARIAGLLSAALLACAGASGVAAAATSSPASARASRPDLVVTAVSLSANGVKAGHSVTITATTKNQGAGRSAPSTTGYYLSRDKTWSKSDTQLGTRNVAALAKNAAVTGKQTMKIPAGTAARTYYVLACADARKVVAESNEKNNCLPAGITVLPASARFPMKANPLTTVTPAFTNPSFTSGSGALTPDAATTLTETMPDGTVYSLAVPADAVSQSVTLKMVPVASVTGAPTTWVAGVSLQPAGLELYQDATLTITPAASLGTADTAFRFFDGGADPGMYPITSFSGGSYTLPVSTLATYGLGASTSTQRATMLAHPPTRNDGQVDNVVGPLTGPAPSSGSPASALRPAATARPGDLIAEVLASYDAEYADVVKPDITAALTNEFQAASAITEAFAWAHQMAAVGAEDDPRVTEVLQLALQVMQAALPKTYQRCVTDHSMADLSDLLGMARTFIVLGDVADFTSALNDVKQCGQFTLTWHSKITQTLNSTDSSGDLFTLNDAYDVGFGPITMTWDNLGEFTGQGTLHYNSASYHAHWTWASCGSTEDYTLTATHDAPVTVTLKMPFLYSKGPGVDPLGATLDLSPSWLNPVSQYSAPDETYHTKSVDNCPNGGTVEGDSLLPGWQVAMESAGLPNPVDITVLDDATVLDHDFTFDGTAKYTLATPYPHEHSDTTIKIVHTPA